VNTQGKTLAEVRRNLKEALTVNRSQQGSRWPGTYARSRAGRDRSKYLSASLKRRDFLRHLASHGCQFLREGGRHSIYYIPQTRTVSSGPRHNEINNFSRTQDLPRSWNSVYWLNLSGRQNIVSWRARRRQTISIGIPAKTPRWRRTESPGWSFCGSRVLRLCLSETIPVCLASSAQRQSVRFR